MLVSALLPVHIWHWCTWRGWREDLRGPQWAKLGGVQTGEVVHFNSPQMHKKVSRITELPFIFLLLPFGKVKTTIHIFTGDKKKKQTKKQLKAMHVMEGSRFIYKSVAASPPSSSCQLHSRRHLSCNSSVYKKQPWLPKCLCLFIYISHIQWLTVKQCTLFY